MRRIAWLGAAALSLTGCVSSQAALEKSVDQVFHSDKSQQEVAACLAKKNVTGVKAMPDGSSVVVVRNGYRYPLLTFTIFAEGAGSRIDYRNNIGADAGIWKPCLDLTLG